MLCFDVASLFRRRTQQNSRSLFVRAWSLPITFEETDRRGNRLGELHWKTAEFNAVLGVERLQRSAYTDSPAD